MVVGELATTTDIVVIGGGPGGYTAAEVAARNGREVILVERASLGGVCLNQGCIPSKALLRVAEAVKLSRESTTWGVEMRASIDHQRMRTWLTEVIGGLSRGVAMTMNAAGVSVMTGTARFSTSNRIAIDGPAGVEHVQFNSAIVATGARSAKLDSLNFDGHAILEPGAALFLDKLPDATLVVGGGYIGIELATIYAIFGSTVTLIEREDRLLPSFPTSLSGPIERSLRRLGVTISLRSTVSDFDGHMALLRQGDGMEQRIRVDTIIVAVGRVPNTDDLSFNAVSVKRLGSGHISVDASRRAAPTICAIGDITPGPPLAHKAMAEATVAAGTVSGERAAFDPGLIPRVVYSVPQVVTIGLTSIEALAIGINARSRRVPFSAIGGAHLAGKPEGHIELVYEVSSMRVLGIHMIGRNVAELSGEAALALAAKVTIEDLHQVVHAHPTLSEAISRTIPPSVL